MAPTGLQGGEPAGEWSGENAQNPVNYYADRVLDHDYFDRRVSD